MLQNPPKVKIKNNTALGNLPQFYWREIGGEYLISNDSGCHAWLGGVSFERFSKGLLGKKDKAFKELSSKGFIRNMLDFSDLAARWKSGNSHLALGPGLHIFVITLRCNHKCLYCQAGAVNHASKGADMNWPTARKSVDFAFQTTAPGLTIEFQGGEPLLNWEILKKTVSYARKKEKLSGKRLSLSLVSNFSLMTGERADFLLKNEVSVCTSLDGPADLHEKNRVYDSGSSYAVAVKWLRFFQNKHNRPAPGYRVFKPSALLTVSRYSLSRHREIIDEYVKLGLEDIFIRPLAPIGYARNLWSKIGYNSAEFSAFYLKSLDYILELNRSGAVIREKMAAIMLEKILNLQDPGYLDARCPCGAAIGQIAYDHNGDLYTCDEGRMVGWEGDDLFRIGNVFKNSYKEAVLSPTARACVASSNLEAQPACSRCVYRPYCGVCPVYNYEVQGSLWGNIPANDRCGLFKGIFDAVFSRLKNKNDAKILEKWVIKR